MNVGRSLTILRKDLARGPRSPFFLWILVFPLFLSAIVQLAFGAFLQGAPTLGLVAPADSAIAAALEKREGLEVVRAPDAASLWALMDGGDVDLGWVVEPGLEASIRRGERPAPQLQVGGQSLASHRIVLGLAVAEAVREVNGDAPLLDVEVVTAGSRAARTLTERLLPLVLLLAMMIAGIFLPAFSLIDERQKGALAAILVTPTTMSEVLLAKGTLGFCAALASAFLTLALNGALPANPLPIALVFVLGGLMVVQLGLLLGTTVKSTTAMFTIWKGSAWFLMLPVVTFLWSSFPWWLGYLSPTYWIVKPAWEVAVEGRGPGDVAFELAVCGALVVALLPLVAWSGRRAKRTIGAG